MERLTLHSPTDTTHPQTVIPIYFIHSVARPFCDSPSCWCQHHKANIVPLLKAVQIGTLSLAESTSLHTGKAE